MIKCLLFGIIMLVEVEGLNLIDYTLTIDSSNSTSQDSLLPSDNDLLKMELGNNE